MTLVEKIKGLFKPKLTIEQFAIAITSDVRLAITNELGSRRHGLSLERIEQGVNIKLGREVSRGSLAWHLEKLKDNNIIKETPIREYAFWTLTSSGREVFDILEKVEREMEAESNKPVSE